MQLRGGRSRRGQERGDDAHVEDGGEAGDDEEAEVARDHRAGRGVARLELDDALLLVGLGLGLGQLGEPEAAARCSDAESPSSVAAPRLFGRLRTRIAKTSPNEKSRGPE